MEGVQTRSKTSLRTDMRGLNLATSPEGRTLLKTPRSPHNSGQDFPVNNSVVDGPRNLYRDDQNFATPTCPASRTDGRCLQERQYSESQRQRSSCNWDSGVPNYPTDENRSPSLIQAASRSSPRVMKNLRYQEYDPFHRSRLPRNDRYSYPERHSYEESQRRPSRVMDSVPAMKISLPTYDGKSRWQTFIRQYEAVTFQWAERKKLQYLLANLRGDAAEFVFDLEPYILEDYFDVVDELEKRFMTHETRETHVRQFYSRRFQRGENIREFASDLKRLIRKAYPTGISCRVMEDMLLKQFFDGFDDEDLHYYVQYLKSPESLDKAVELVYEYDDWRDIQRESSRSRKTSTWKEGNHKRETSDKEKVRFVKEKSSEASNLSRGTLTELTEAVSSMSQMIQKLIEKQNQTNSGPGKVQQRNSDCYKCSRGGHFARHCPTRTENLKMVHTTEEEDEISSDIGSRNLN